MNTTARHLLLVLAIAFAFAPALLRAETVSWPKDKPAITIELPADWKVGSNIDEELRLVGPITSNLTIQPIKNFKVTITSEESARAGACGLCKSAAYFGEAGTCGETEEMTVAGHKAYSVIGKGGPVEKQFITFTPDGKNWFGAAAATETGSKPDPKAQEVLKAIKGQGGSDAEE